MSRTTIEIPINIENIDKVLYIVDKKMEASGFKQRIVDGETVWTKGDGVLMKMQCICSVFTDKSVLIQGWMKDSVTGESDLEGVVAMVPKKKLKGLIAEIREEITSKDL